MPRETTGGAVAVDTWTSFVKAALGAVGFVLLAVGPIVPSDAFPHLPHYAYAVGGLLVLAAATMKLRTMLIVLGCLGLTAGLTLTLAAAGSDPDRNVSALALYCAAALLLGAAGRQVWMAVPFLLVPLLVVAPAGTGWEQSREAFADGWTAALGCDDCLWAGLPAGLAVAGAAIGQLRGKPPVPVRPSGIPLLLACAGLVMGGLVVASLLPPQYAFAQTASLRVAVLAGALGWVGLAYQLGRVALVWMAGVACLLVLAGALAVDPYTATIELDQTLAITVLASLVPAILAGVGLLARKWLGTERPRTPPASAPLRTALGESPRVAALVPEGPVFAPRAAPAVDAAPSPAPPGPPPAVLPSPAPDTAAATGPAPQAADEPGPPEDAQDVDAPGPAGPGPVLPAGPPHPDPPRGTKVQERPTS